MTNLRTTQTISENSRSEHTIDCVKGFCCKSRIEKSFCEKNWIKCSSSEVRFMCERNDNKCFMINNKETKNSQLESEQLKKLLQKLI